MNPKKILFFLSLLSLALNTQQSFGKDNTETDDEGIASLDYLKDLSLSIYSKKYISVREAPGTASVITREEILNSGARDLLDALNLLVPGFNFASDVEGTVSVNIRGIWAEEGKILVMIDGLEMNERVFGNTQFGNNFNLDNVERIEIIRGPGSAIYGGYAEAAVVNVITRGASQNQAFLSGTNSQMSKTFTQRGGTLGFGKEFRDFSISLATTYMAGNRSQLPYYDGTTYFPTLDNSQLRLLNINLALEYNGLQFRSLTNQYKTTQVEMDGGPVGPSAPYSETFDTSIQELKYEIEVNNQLKITPRLSYKVDTPWKVSSTDPNAGTFDKTATKQTFDVLSSWDITDKLDLVSGFEVTKSSLTINNPAKDPFFNMADGNTQSFYNYAIYAQSTLNTPYMNFTAGARYDWTNRFGAAFVPRLGLTQVFDKLHVKAIYSQSFRVPIGILQDRAPPGIRLNPEKSSNLEAEIGYKITKNISLTANVFDTKIDKPLVYQAIGNNFNGKYTNFGQFGTRGMEVQAKYKEARVILDANYSFYAISTNTITTYAVPNDSTSVLGAPNHKVNVRGTYKIRPNLYFTPSLQFFSQRWYQDSNGNCNSLPSAIYYNVNVRMENLFTRGLEISLGIMNLFDKEIYYPAGFAANLNPIPGASRELNLQARYSVPI